MPAESPEFSCNDNQDNDCDGLTETCNASVPDLTVASISNPPASRKRERSFNIKAKIKNNGNGAADKEFTVRYYLSKNRDKSLNKDEDILLTGDVVMSSLIAGAGSIKKIQVNIGTDAPPGKYYVKVCADTGNDLAETDEDNNCRASKRKIRIK
jgi:subtilase family serine protease